MNAYVAELVGTALLVLLGNGVVANVLLNKTKGNNAGWLAITAGWGLAVFVGVSCTAEFSGAHLNPAVTLGAALATDDVLADNYFAWSLVPGYVLAQMAGGLLGAVLVYFFYQPHWSVTEDADAKLASFCTGPAIRSPASNLLGETLATFVLVFTVLLFVLPSVELASGAEPPKVGLGALGALPVGLLVFSIGVSLGGTTGYAINPARDLAPRLAHAVLPIPGKRDADWNYAWIPVVGPLAGGALAALLFRLLVLVEETGAAEALN